MSHCLTMHDLPTVSPERTGWPWTEASPPLSNVRADGSVWPRVTVVTPSYNQAPFLEETIRSVLLQGYPNLEYIIMDGGSTDGSVELIQKYAPWLAYWVSAQDAGQADAINRGWEMATGDALTWLNSDDILLPGALETTVRTLYEAPDTELVYGNVYAVNTDSDAIYLVRGAPFAPADILVRARNPIPQPGFLMKRNLLQRIGWLDPELHFCMDFDYWSRLALHDARAVHVNSVLAHFRQHDLAKTTALYKTRIADRERVFEKVFSAPQLLPMYRQKREIARGYVMLRAAYIAYKASDPVRTRRYAWHHICAMHGRSTFMGIYLLLSTLGGRRGLQLAKKLRSLQRGRRPDLQQVGF